MEFPQPPLAIPVLRQPFWLLRRAPRGGRGGQAQLPPVRRSSLEVAMAPFIFASLASSLRWLRQTGAATARAEVECLEVDMASRGTCRCRRFFLDEVGRRRVDAWNRDLFAGNCLRLCALQLANCCCSCRLELEIERSADWSWKLSCTFNLESLLDGFPSDFGRG